ncbi:MAG: hypothetical protein IKP88_00420 [Lachnospiraceae bacterium]|nr:hypothetical protein [Lachnospiraceae bacterium]
MRKYLNIIVVVILAFALTACGSGEKDSSSGSGNNTSNSGGNQSGNSSSNDSGSNGSDSSKKDDSQSGTSTSDSGDNGGTQDRPERNEGMNRNSMEKKIAAYLSEIGGPDEISLCDFDSVKYEPYTEWSIYGDQWEVMGAKTKKADLLASLDKQLIDGYGFQRDSALLGETYFKRAGSKKLGIIVYCDSDGSSDSISMTIWMTHAPECYSQEYIKQQEASMPDIIPAKSALDILPENFLIEIEFDYAFETLGRKDGNYIQGMKYKDSSDSGWAYAYIANSDGGYDKYSAGSYDGTKFSKDSSISASDMENLLSNWYDIEGMGDNGSLSAWGQMSLDFNEGKTFGGANWRFSISTSLVKTGTENIAGVECAVCEDDSLWTKHLFAYDPSTGVMFKIVEKENDEEKELFKVVKYDANPEGLGNYKG